MKELIVTPVINTDIVQDRHGSWHRRVPKRDKTISARQWRKLQKRERIKA